MWKLESDTISMPDVAALPQGGSLVVLRSGGERGKILVGQMTDKSQASAELVAVNTGGLRVEPPTLLVADKQAFVTYAAGDKPVRDKFLVASSHLPELPTTPKEVLRSEQGIISPSLARISEGVFVAQFTRGIAGKQEVVSVVLNANLEPQGEPAVVSPSGRDAYEGLVVGFGGVAYHLYFLRQEYGHELWVTRSTCK